MRSGADSGERERKERGDDIQMEEGSSKWDSKGVTPQAV